MELYSAEVVLVLILRGLRVIRSHNLQMEPVAGLQKVEVEGGSDLLTVVTCKTETNTLAQTKFKGYSDTRMI